MKGLILLSTEVSSVPVIFRAIASRSDQDIYSLRFEFINVGLETIVIVVFRPLTAFEILATSDGESVPVHRPALDIRAMPVSLQVPPAVTIGVDTPVTLRIAEGSELGDDGFVWTIPHAKETLSLSLQLTIPPPFDMTCPVEFQ